MEHGLGMGTWNMGLEWGLVYENGDWCVGMGTGIGIAHNTEPHTVCTKVRSCIRAMCIRNMLG